MKNPFLISYSILRWLLLILLALIVFLFFILESPSTFLSILKTPLKKQGIEYTDIKGGFLSGFTLTDINYKNQVQAKELQVKIDFHQLENRVLFVENLTLKDAHIEKDFLASFIDINSSEEKSSEGNDSLPFDKIVVKSADISLKDITYDAYHVNSAKLHLENFDSDMKEKHKGNIDFELDSNVSQVKLKANFENENYDVIANIEGEKSFIAPFLGEYNVSLLSNPKVEIKAKGDLNELDYHVNVLSLDVKQNAYFLETKSLESSGKFHIKKRELSTIVQANIESNVGTLVLDADASFDLDDLNNTLLFRAETEFKAKESHLLSGLKEQNISIEQFPNIKIFAKGDMKDVSFTANMKSLKASQNDLNLDLNELDIKGNVSPLNGNTSVLIHTVFDSSLVGGELDLKSSLNFNDINNTLLFDVNSDLTVNGAYLNPMLADSNVSLESGSSLLLLAKGNMKNVEFSTELKDVKGKQNDIKFHLQDLQLEGHTQPLGGDTSLKLLSHFDSSVAGGEIDLKVKLNFNDINNTLELDSMAKLDAHAAYLNPLLKEQDMELQGDTHLEISVKGGMENLLINLDAEAKMLKDKKLSNLTIHSSPIRLNLKTNYVDGSVKIKSDGEEMGMDIESSFSGDYTKPKEMKVKNKIELGHFNAFGLNLDSLQPLAVDLQNGAEGMTLTLDSPRLKLTAKSSDNDHYTFELKTEELQISKIIDLPRELKKKFFKIDIAGDVSISKQFFNIKGNIASNENFKLKIDAKNDEKGLLAKLSTKHLRLRASGDIKRKNIKVNIQIASLEKVQKEFQALYPFSLVKVDGALNIDASLASEVMNAKVTSKKLTFDGFNIEALELDAKYNKELLTLNTFNFKTSGFEDKSLNQKFYLNQKGLVHLGEKRDLLLDMHPNILVQAKGTTKNLKGDFKIKKLPLGHPDYGDMVLNCDIHYEQTGEKKRVTGAVVLREMKLFYEAKFLEADYDSDVVVITKKDKNKKKGKDSFLEDTFIDLSIYAPNAKYITRDIDLEFTVDVHAKKEFGFELGMLGKVKEINGRVEQAPKLFSVVDSNIVFGGGKEINPLLDIQVDYELPDILISILIHGNAKRPKINFSSEPAMPKKDILSYLLLGVSTAALGEGDGSLGREVQLFIMNQAARDFAYEVELDRVFIKDDGTGEGYAVQLGKKVNDKTMAIVESSKEGNSFIIEYEVSKHIQVEVGQHQKTVPSQSIDIFFRKKFR